MPDFVSGFYLDKAVDVSAERFLDVPYIANWIFEHPGLDLNLKGIWIADPSLTWGVVQQEIPALRFARVSTHHTTQTLHLYSPIPNFPGAPKCIPFQQLFLGSTGANI